MGDVTSFITYVEFQLGDHSFSTFAKFSKNLTFLTPYNEYVRVLGGLRNVIFWETLRTN